MSIYGELSEGNVLKGTVSGGQSLSGSADKINVIKGESAYQLAVLNGFEGTEAEWLESLHGRDGKSVNVDTYYETDEGTLVMFSDGTEVLVRKGEDGKSAYEYAKEKGYDGTEEEFAEMLANAGSGGGGVIEETDPTVPSWAKQTNKPTYSKSEVGLGNVDNVRQYSASNPPPYPVTSVNGKTGAVTVSVPTQTSQLTNNSGFITKAVSDLANYYLKSETLTKAEINALVSAIPKFTISVVSSLPTSNISETTVYLVKSGSGGDLYTEYIRVNNAWEILGSQKVDLTGYAKLTDIPTKLSELENDSEYVQLDDLSPYAKKNDIPSVPTKVSELANDSGYLTSVPGEYVTETELAAKKYLTSFTESDPTVPSWAKQTNKPSYSKTEVGLGNVDNVKQYSTSNPPPYPVTSVNGKTGAVTVTVPTKVSELTNDSKYLTSVPSEYVTETELTAKGYAVKSNAETWTFTLANGSTVTKKVVIA